MGLITLINAQMVDDVETIRGWLTAVMKGVLPKAPNVKAAGGLANGDDFLSILDFYVSAPEKARTWLGSAPWLLDGVGLKDFRLFGAGAEKSWTVAIISDLKPLATDLSSGMLRWVLSTAMPLRDDFALYLNNTKVSPSKVGAKRVGR